MPVPLKDIGVGQLNHAALTFGEPTDAGWRQLNITRFAIWEPRGGKYRFTMDRTVTIVPSRERQFSLPVAV